MAPIDGLSFQLYSARTFEPLEAQFELLAGLGYKKVEPFGGLFNDPQKLKSQLERHAMSAPTGCAPIRWPRSGCAETSAFGRSTRRRRRQASATAARPSGPRLGASLT